MKKFRNVPAIITLLAGFVTSVVMIVNKYSLKPFLWILVLVMAGFYISGIIIRVILNKAFNDDKEKDKESQDTESSQDDSPSEDSNEKADNQSEKMSKNKE
ncbi:MAG: hypothetical protein ACLVCT_10295 [Lachnospira sp.]|jgi:hypothetical protein